MSLPALSTLVTGFFLRHLAVERNVSPHTTAAYRDALKLFLRFAAERCRRPTDRLTMDDLTAPVVLEFLADLETRRGNTPRTRNARLAALQTFFRYVATREPALASQCDPVLAIPGKKAMRPVLGYLSEQELGHLLAQVDRSDRHGERDYVLLAALYDTGARIQELLDLTPQDFHLDTPPFVRIRGKGRRERLCPLLPQTAGLVRRFLFAQGRRLDEAHPLLQNRCGTRLSRHGARYLLLKHLRRAAHSMPALARTGISPHTLRHTKAMHLLQSGVPLVTVKDFLGHVDLKSTEVYVQADLEMKRDALAIAGGPRPAPARRTRLPSSLIAWLESLSRVM
jgi:site-specific recombinase XerD